MVGPFIYQNQPPKDLGFGSRLFQSNLQSLVDLEDLEELVLVDLDELVLVDLELEVELALAFFVDSVAAAEEVLLLLPLVLVDLAAAEVAVVFLVEAAADEPELPLPLVSPEISESE